VPANALVLGKHSGRTALSLRYRELGFELVPEELDAAYTRFTELADRKKKVYDQDLLSLLSAGAESQAKVLKIEESLESVVP